MQRRDRNRLSRRLVLRGVLASGVAVAVPLPRLVGMMNGNGTAYAAGEPLPKRFGTWFFGNGIIPERWIPAKIGAGSEWELSPSLVPLQDVKPWLSVITGLAIKFPNIAAHKSMPAAALTGHQSAADVTAPSIDQVIAPLISPKELDYPTGIHVGISNHTGAGALDFNISFNGPNAPNHPEYDPVALFKKLLSFSGPAPMATGPDPALLRRKRVLDAVLENAKSLRARLGTEDQARLDHHLEGIDQLQKQLVDQSTATKPMTTAMLVDPDMAYPDRGAIGEITRKRGAAFSDLLVFAMAADLTRVFSYVFTCAACHGSYKAAGLDDVTFHEDYGHRLSKKGEPYATEGFHTGILYAMSTLADLGAKLKATPDGAGNLLDNSCTYVTSCTSESKSHSGADFPLMVLGKGSGTLKTDQHIRMPGDNVSKVPFTLLTAMGGTATEFGKDEGLVKDVVPQLLA
jgi:hypothetical protein